MNKDEVIELLHILGDTYSELTLRHQLKQRNVETKDTASIDEIEDLLFNSASLLLTINEQAHAARICECEDDTNIRLQRQLFDRMFKSRLETNRWWSKHIEAHGGFRVASPQSQTSYQPSQQDESKWRPELNTLPESFGELKKKRRRTP